MKDLTSLLSDLNVQYNSNRHLEAAKVCKELIEAGVEDKVSILGQWLVSLIKSDCYKQGWDLLKQYDEELKGLYHLERLYIFYKLGYTKCFEALYERLKDTEQANSFENRGLLHVRAQFCFKNGKFEEATEIYQLLATHNEQHLDNETELACNERAAVGSRHRSSSESYLVTSLNEDSYDLLFNESLIALRRGDLNLSLKYLNQASSLAAQEGSADDQNAIELQKAYVLQASGAKNDAKDILNDLVSKTVAGSTMHLLAQNNLKSFHDFSKYTTNIPLLLRELNVAKLSYKVSSLGHEQQQIILNNILFLNLFSGCSIQSKKSLVSKTLANYQKKIANIVLEPYSTQARLLFSHTMSAISCGTEGSVIGLLVLTVQLHVLEKNFDKAVVLCEAFLNKDVKGFSYEHRIACYILFQLYRETGGSSSSNWLLENLYAKVSDDSVKEDPEFWRYIAFSLLAQGFGAESEDMFAKLQKLSPELQLLNSSTEQRTDLNSNLDSLVESIDVNSLKKLGIAPFEGQRTRMKDTSLGKVAKKRRVHKNRKLPKNFDAGREPNPERWLPLKDRSDFKPKKKLAAKQTQGSAISRKSEQSLDISKKKRTKKGKK
ncbi:LAQU0S08e03774g1_1 [Lachancea quebecensis]|uniref:Signal recognition particle subunit SRP72 n=1 Tax=Lachancea quebecensis TaxID=1654605 RepID=A0A0P1KTG1_9SACH|nr:LAQU0S08e03774g1_1 [Lachancea quebecensis]